MDDISGLTNLAVSVHQPSGIDSGIPNDWIPHRLIVNLSIRRGFHESDKGWSYHYRFHDRGMRLDRSKCLYGYFHGRVESHLGCICPPMRRWWRSVEHIVEIVVAKKVLLEYLVPNLLVTYGDDSVIAVMKVSSLYVGDISTTKHSLPA